MVSELISEIDLLLKQVDSIEVLGEYADTTHHVEFGSFNGQYYLKLNGAIVKLDPDAKEVIANFYGQISQIYDDFESGIDPQFAALRDILVAKNKFVQDSLERLGDGKLSKTLRELNFNTEVTPRSIRKQLDHIEQKEQVERIKNEHGIDIKFVGPGEETDSPLSPMSFQKAMTIIKECKDCPEPYVPGMGEYDDPNKILLNPKPNNSGMFTYADMDNDINLSTKAIILDTNGNILILKDAYSDYWDLPGGHVNDGESIDLGLKREVYEETGLTVTSSEQRFARELLLGDPPPRIVVFYVAAAVGKVKLSEEHTGAAWVPMKNLNVYNLGKFSQIIREIMMEVLPNSTDKTLFKNGHEMEVTDLGQPYYHQKHHQMDTYEMGEPDALVDNIQIPRHQFNEPPDIKISTVKDVISEHNDHTNNPVIVKFYSDAGNPEVRERPFIEADRDASTSYEAGYAIPYSSAAQVDVGDDVVKQTGGAAGGAGVAGEGSGGIGSIGAKTTGNTFTPTYGRENRRKSHFDSSLNQKQNATEIGTFEGTTTRPDMDAYEYENRTLTGNHDLPPEQQPLGEGENVLWLTEEEHGPNTSHIIEGHNVNRNTDDAIEQFTNLSNDFFKPFIKKAFDDEELAIVSDSPKDRMEKGHTLIVAGYGNVAVADREGHLISLDALRKALPKFMSRPEYANVNIFHSGVQVASDDS